METAVITVVMMIMVQVVTKIMWYYQSEIYKPEMTIDLFRVAFIMFCFLANPITGFVVLSQMSIVRYREYLAGKEIMERIRVRTIPLK